jgi:hypothetical protein
MSHCGAVWLKTAVRHVQGASTSFTRRIMLLNFFIFDKLIPYNFTRLHRLVYSGFH